MSTTATPDVESASPLPAVSKAAALPPFPIAREACRQERHLPALLIPVRFCGLALKSLKAGELFHYPRIPPIQVPPSQAEGEGEEGAAQQRLVLLDPKAVEILPGQPPLQRGEEKEQEQEAAAAPSPLATFMLASGARLVQHTLHLTYEHLNVEQALALLLPPGLEAPSSFETIGHIAHLNLREPHLPHKHLIGQVLLDKNKNIRTVVHKTSNIHHTFRFFEMEVIAGERDTLVEMRESGCRFAFDYASVYWNSRLMGEHARITHHLLHPTPSLVCDVFGGVGPFAIPAGKQGCIVFANDLNPASHRYLCGNVVANGIQHRVRPYNMDGRAFIGQALQDLNEPGTLDALRAAWHAQQQARHKSASAAKRRKLAGERGPEGSQPWFPEAGRPYYHFDHYVMNLPDTALEFLGMCGFSALHPCPSPAALAHCNLTRTPFTTTTTTTTTTRIRSLADAFRGLFHGKEAHFPPGQPMPTIHVHCFARGPDMEAELLARASAALGHPLTRTGGDVLELHNVRDVAPNKWMLCLSFRLPRAVAFAPVPATNAQSAKVEQEQEGAEQQADEQAGGQGE
jgi:tRNA (guanine37-N1)-methyltransferase